MERRGHEVIPGLWTLPVALPGGGLDVVFSYALEVEGGLVLIDAGWGSRASLASLAGRLAELGGSLSDVRGVLFTHAHPDHYGLAGAVKELSGAWLALHPAEHIIRPGSGRPEFFEALAAEAALELGDPDARATFQPELPVPDPDRTFVDGEVIELAPWQIKVIHTPGHTRGHTCFLLDQARVVLLGDHLLSRTTPNVSHWPGGDDDPLGDYIDSLRLISRVGVGCVGLPGHEEVIHDIPARALEVLAHHESQLADVTELVGNGHDTIGAVAARMRWSRRWRELGQIDRIMAVGEAHAHLRTLETRGQLRRIEGPPRRFVLG